MLHQLAWAVGSCIAAHQSGTSLIPSQRNLAVKATRVILYSISVPSGPADVRAVTSGPGSVMVSWRPPGSPNGVIKKYTVFRREVMNGEEVAVKESSVLSGPNYLELTGLEWNRRYDVWVKAATDVGYGSSSIITSIILGRIGKDPNISH